MSWPACPICQKHRGGGELVGPIMHEDELLHVAHRATGSLGYAFIETRRHVPYLDGLTDAEAEAVGRATVRLAGGFRSELEVDFVHSMVAGLAVPHFHQHVYVRHSGTPERYAWWEQWPQAPHGDNWALARRLRRYFDPKDEA